MARIVKFVKLNGEEVQTTADVAREFRLVRKALKEKGRAEAAQERWEAFCHGEVIPAALNRRPDLDEIAAVGPGGKKKQASFKGENGETVTVSYRTYTKVRPELADRAMDLIRAELEAVEQKEGKLPELLAFFVKAFDAKRGWSVGPEYLNFLKAGFRKRRLQDAQALLLEALYAENSEYYVRVTRRDPDAGHEAASA